MSRQTFAGRQAILPLNKSKFCVQENTRTVVSDLIKVANRLGARKPGCLSLRIRLSQRRNQQ